MGSLLVAGTPQVIKSLTRILHGHRLVITETLQTALVALQNETFDAIIICLHFDESRMFEMIREVKRDANNAARPIVCYCARDTQMTRTLHESLEFSTRELGAWMYLDEHMYSACKDPDLEIRRIIERCLVGETRKHIQLQRIEFQKRRLALQALRMLMEAQDWSPEQSKLLTSMKRELDLLQSHVQKLQLSADVQRAKIDQSRSHEDRVPQRVTVDENGMSQTENAQSDNESEQSGKEIEISKKERRKGPEKLRRKSDKSVLLV